MTTVITNGYYLLADNRTSAVSSDRSDYHTKNMLNPEITRNYRICGDTSAKIVVLDHRSNIRKTDESSPKCLAMAFAGVTSSIMKAHRFIGLANRSKWAFREFDEQIRGVTGFEGECVAVFSDCTSVASRGERLRYKKPGEYIGTGTGWQAVKLLSAVLPTNLSIEDRFFIAACVDKSTSPSYSVFGVREMEYYRYVLNDLDFIKQRFKKTMTELDFSQVQIRDMNNII